MPAPASLSALGLGLSCASAAVAEAATYPVDAIKTQLQLQRTVAAASAAGGGSGAQQRPAGVLRLARAILARQGLAGLYAGLSPAVLRHFFYTGTRVTLYEQLRGAYAAAQQRRGAAGTSGPTAGLGPNLVFGLTAGAVGQMVAVPADLVKVQMQADVREVVAGRRAQRQVTSIPGAIAALVRRNGVAGLWRGGLPAVQRAALVNLGELASYSQAKQAITASGWLPQGLPTHLGASVCSGFVSAVISTPADVMKTRLMAQQAPPRTAAPAPAGQPQQRPSSQAASASRLPAAAHASTSTGSGSSSSSHGHSRSFGTLRRREGVATCRGTPSRGGAFCSGSSSSVRRQCSVAPGGAVHYRGMVDCAVQTVHQEGLLAMYKGFWPTWARLGPWQLVFWVSYEQLRAAAGISTF